MYGSKSAVKCMLYVHVYVCFTGVKENTELLDDVFEESGA